MPKKEKTVGAAASTERTYLNMGALARLLPVPKPKLTRGAKRRKKKV